MTSAEFFTLHDSTDAVSDSSDTDDVDDFVKKKLETASARAEFHQIADDDDPYNPGKKIPPGMRRLCVMFRAYEKSKDVIEKLTGMSKVFATFGRDLVRWIDELEQELHNARPLGDEYAHSEIVLHNLTRWRIWNGAGPGENLVQLIKLDKKGLPLSKKFRAGGFYEPVARYVGFFLFLIPKEKHDALERWCDKLYNRGDSYDLRTTTFNMMLRLADLWAFEKVLLQRGRSGCFGLPHNDYDEDQDPEDTRKPVRVLQALLSGKVEHNCCTLVIKSLKKAGALTEEDVPKWDERWYTNMDLMRLMLSKTKDGSSPRKWNDSNHFVISKELHVTWRKFKSKEDREKAEIEFKRALVAQHSVGLAAADEAFDEYLKKSAKSATKGATKGTTKKRIVYGGGIINRDADDDDETRENVPLVKKK